MLYPFIIILFLFPCSKDKIPHIEPETVVGELFVAGYLPYYGIDRVDFKMFRNLDRLYYFSILPDTLGNYRMPENHHQNIDLLNSELSGLNTELFIVIGGWYESETIFPMAASK
ncbi:MAG: hypothetical protein GQ525_06495 [Draconibacterium sp.]|nr:hypothetical protein [Draconibacterium sp.]